MEPPKNLTELQSFLGLVGYYRRFIPTFANIAQDLFELLKKDVSYEWSDGCNQSFKNLKAALMTAPVLRYPDFSKPFILFTNASLSELGVVLSQNNEEGINQPIAYFSRTLKKHKRNYTVTEKKCLAVLLRINESGLYI